MNKVLAIDTSTSRTSVAIIQDGKVLYSDFKDGATAHGHSLPALVQDLLLDCVWVSPLRRVLL